MSPGLSATRMVESEIQLRPWGGWTPPQADGWEEEAARWRHARLLVSRGRQDEEVSALSLLPQGVLRGRAEEKEGGEYPRDVLTFGLKSVSFRSDYPRSTGRREREGRGKSSLSLGPSCSLLHVLRRRESSSKFWRSLGGKGGAEAREKRWRRRYSIEGRIGLSSRPHPVLAYFSGSPEGTEGGGGRQVHVEKRPRPPPPPPPLPPPHPLLPPMFRRIGLETSLSLSSYGHFSVHVRSSSPLRYFLSSVRPMSISCLSLAPPLCSLSIFLSSPSPQSCEKKGSAAAAAANLQDRNGRGKDGETAVLK